MKTNGEYVLKSSQIKLDLTFEKGKKEGEDFQSLSEKHSQFIVKCQSKLKSLVIELGDLNTVYKISLPSYPLWNRSTAFQKNF